MHSQLRLLNAALILLSIGTVSAAEKVELMAFQVYTPHTHFSPYYDGPDRQTYVALNSEKEWQSWWALIEPRMSHDESQGTRNPLPKIDFERHTLLAIALGSRPSGAFSVAVESIRQFPSEIQVTAYELTPGTDCVVPTVVTHPIAYALIPHTKKPVHFDVRKAAMSCSQ